MYIQDFTNRHMLVPLDSFKVCCHEKNNSSLIQIISSEANSFTFISSGRKFNNAIFHDNWHGKVRYKTYFEIWVADNFRYNICCQWINLGFLAYNQ